MTAKYNLSRFNLPGFKETRDKQHYQFINPLLECDFWTATNNQNLNELREKINSIINNEINDHHISFASVYYRDLNNGPWFGINEKEFFSPASLIKVPLMIAYYKAAEEKPTILQEEIVNTLTYDPSEQNILPEKTLELNQPYSVEELIKRMIIFSDNNAYRLLLDHIDNDLVYKVYTDLGVDISKAKNNPTGNILSVSGYASFFRILYNASYLNRSMSEKALNLLSQTTFHQGLVAGVPNNVTVAHKFGERHYTNTGEYQLHDCGIIYVPDKPYLLCVMTRGNNFNNLSQIISQISETIYQEINQK